jgi:hypothetical protein
MAFNPFTTFQKNQKFWMAAILLICMVTFVFCTGIAGMDLGDKIIRKFSRSGPTAVTVASNNLSSFDLGQLREQRNMVNEFMRRSCQFTIENLNIGMQRIHELPVANEPKKAEEQKKSLAQFAFMKQILLERMRKPRYFEGGTKFDDLVEFKLWQAQADKLNIRLLDEDVRRMLYYEFFTTEYSQQPLIDARQLREAQFSVAHSEDARSLYKYLAEEFRVRLARVALLEMRPANFNADFHLPMPDPSLPTEMRAPVSLAQLWNVYKEKRSEFDVTLIPIRVEDFAKDAAKEKGAPSDGDLEKLFAKYKTEKYDPTSPFPSFETPPEVRAEFIMADPTSPIYVAAAQAKLLLERSLPLAGSPLESPLVVASRAAAFGAANQKQAQDILEGLGQKKFDLYGAADIGSSHFHWPLAAHLAERDPAAVASLMGALPAALGDPALGGTAAWAGFMSLATDPTLKPKEYAALAAGYAAESERRTLPAQRVLAAGLTGEPFALVATAWEVLKLEPPPWMMFMPRGGRMLLPLAIVQPELEKVVEDRTAERWATRNLLTVKRLLDNSRQQPEAIKRIINTEVPKYNLTHVVTKKYHSRYDIDQAPELKPLRDAYDRYYGEINAFEKRDLTPERMLHDNDFYKLFFDNESFASASKFAVRPWPPDIRPSQMQVFAGLGPRGQERMMMSPEIAQEVQRFMQQQGGNPQVAFKMLDLAHKPILFWRNDDRPPEFPQNLAAAKDRVVAAYEAIEARESKALPLARKIGEELANRQGEFNLGLLHEKAQEARRDPIVLSHIAPWVPQTIGDPTTGGHREYFPYQLPKDTITMPREDMVTGLLALYDLKGPIEIKLPDAEKKGEPAFVKQLNDLNKALYDKVKREKNPQGQYVQVLTNKPQNTYYVAVVTRKPTADPKDFQDRVLRFASEAQFRFVDTFVNRAQAQMGEQFHKDLVAQMREKWVSNIDDDARSKFDEGDHGS